LQTHNEQGCELKETAGVLTMSSKTKKAKSSGRFGARYGKTVRARLVNVEKKQRKKQKCPFCEKEFPIEQSKKIVRPSPILLVK